MNEYRRAEEGLEKRSLGTNLAGNARASTPALGAEKKQYIPNRFCITWNRDGCNDDQCKFDQEVPQPRPGKGDKSRVCKFWEQGSCNRGDECKFKHEGKQEKPRKATPARSNSTDSKSTGGGRRNRRKSRSASRSKFEAWSSQSICILQISPLATCRHERAALLRASSCSYVSQIRKNLIK